MKKVFLFFWFVISVCNLYAQKNTIRYTSVKGLSIAYIKAGSGPAIVLLHGFTQDSRIWKLQIESLSENFTVIAWDAPGAGLSGDPTEKFTIGDWADCLAGLLDAAGIKKAHILGLSWGGLLAQEFYKRYPNRVLSLILADTTIGWTGALSDSVANALLAACIHDSSLPSQDFVLKYLPGMFSDSVPQPIKEELARIMSDTHPIGFRVMATAVARADTRTLLPNISVPTLLIWGKADKRSPLKAAYQMRDAIHGAKLEIISGAGHVSNMEKPIQFNKAVKDFCLTISTGK
ncbi:MAG TPA: alpha/beta hydrolase [Chitinophagaceae bacterium]|nr:alpha/beta hydrolase [Chitinophagaceae bacterium]